MWDVATGHPLTRMSTGRTEKHRETIVWSLIVLDDFTVVSGDSRYDLSYEKVHMICYTSCGDTRSNI